MVFRSQQGVGHLLMCNAPKLLENTSFSTDPAKNGRVTTIFKKEASLSSICSTVVRLNFHCTFDNVNYAITLLTGKKDSSRGPTVVETE